MEYRSWELASLKPWGRVLNLHRILLGSVPVGTQARHPATWPQGAVVYSGSGSVVLPREGSENLILSANHIVATGLSKFIRDCRVN